MEEFRGTVVTDRERQQFRERLEQYEDRQLNQFHEYFQQDLIYIVESLDTLSLLGELKVRTGINVERYQSIKKQCGASAFAEMLVEDIYESGRDAVLGLWESLFVLQNDHPHPNLLGALDEISQQDHDLAHFISLDKNGHDLPKDLKDCQSQHKRNLWEKTEYLKEHVAPGLNSEHQKFNISSRYLDLIVVSSHQLRARSENEVIATGGIHEHYLQRAQSNLERISPNRLFRWCHRKRCVPQAVLVSGVPGVGKTTLMQKFVYDWANGNLYQRFAFVFFFKFRDLNNKEELSLAQMIVDEYPYLHSQLDTIFKHPTQLLFIFDGLDESKSQTNFQPNNCCANPYSQQAVSVIVSSLANQTLLTGCSVLITSRPSNLATTETRCFHRISEIMGFFPKQREEYFQKFFRNPEVAESVFNYVRENGILYTFCYIPSYCWIICTVLSTCSDQNQNRPQTVTQLFVMFVANVLANHSHDVDGEMLRSIARLAEDGVMNHNLAFDDEALRSFGVDTHSRFLSSFMVECDQGPRSFLHLTIQEFMAALLHYLDYSPDRLQDSLLKAKSYEDGRGEIFLRFVCGLSHINTRARLKAHVGDLSTPASKDVIRFLQSAVTQVWNPERPDADKRKILNIFACLTESQNKGLVSSSLGSNGRFEFSEFHLAPLDCTVLAFILESCRETELLNLGACFIQTEGLGRIAPALHTVIDLSLATNNLRDEDVEFIYSMLTHPQCRIKKLSLRNNGLTEECCGQLAWAIKENTSLRDLDLSKNKLAGEDFYQLLEVFSDPTCQIEHLALQEAKLTPEYTESFLSLTNNRNLTHLNISSNFFGDAGYPHIQKLILEHPSLREIKVGMNDFSEQTERNLLRLKGHQPNMTINL
ncbi:NACHT, LRR and PYD domains-containing protein 12 [Xenopus tropicalis]|uniref:NACHT, LRR and PYD domains-containing protein 12 n=2 Tax=Xenopus tropicalis TaxID=8364 RepID=A0A8J0R4K0_XENTR|nr:NACHT, LRR and PYD domains-containing protein 12 [Xenopus tropicalis]|eukprot:XP_004917629.1 PREDICTED: NACHT, LRR and PYD domains-containing protein 12-like isoform X2 [Xenopus tropicalis]